jgi:NAD(P)-dependent dehydrogenase (short-subunit alcohol dehydrogenase family)
MQQDSRVAIVTGSGTGVGAATAERLAGKGWRVVINYSKSETEARETQVACAARGVETLLIQGDVAVDADCRHLAQAALDAWGRIDALVNNAGITKFVKYADLNDLNAEDFQRIYSVNVIGAYQMVRACVPAMKRQGAGAVVNVSSIAGITGMGSSIAYAASKGALNNMTFALARALGPEIRVNAICPGFIEGRWLRSGFGEQAYESSRKRYSDVVPLGSTAQPDDIAETIVWLIEGARLVTGETIMVDGGMHLAMLF